MFDSAWAAELALIRRPCPWCGRSLRPCNLARHIEVTHFRQLNIDEVIAQLLAERETR
jgi:hypothetical protein